MQWGLNASLFQLPKVLKYHFLRAEDKNTALGNTHLSKSWSLSHSSNSGGIFLAVEFSPSERPVVSSRTELNKLLSSQTTKVWFAGSDLLQGSQVQSTKAYLRVHLPIRNQQWFPRVGSRPWMLIRVHTSTALCSSFRAEELMFEQRSRCLCPSCLWHLCLDSSRSQSQEERVCLHTHAHPPAPLCTHTPGASKLVNVFPLLP